MSKTIEELEECYKLLKAQIQKDTSFQSNPHSWLTHKAYKAIVTMGEEVVPFIIADLKKSLETDKDEDYPGWWAMYALPEITGVNIEVGGPEVKRVGGFSAVSVDGVSRFWVDWYEKRKQQCRPDSQ